MHDRCIEKTIGKIRPAETETDLSFQWRALMRLPAAFIFHYGERMAREKPKLEERPLDSSLRLIVPSGYVRVTLSSRICASEEGKGGRKRTDQI